MKITNFIKNLLVSMIAVFGLVAIATQSQAAPLAGTTIGNQAAATYTDSSNANRTATSNTVNTIVQHVPGFTLTADQSKSTSPGGTVYFGHTITITGNGNETINLGVSDVYSGTFNFASSTMYIDANGDGLPDNFTALTSTGVLASGGSFNFVVAGVVPGTALDGTIDKLTVTGTSTATGAVVKTNTDTVTVSTNAVIQITKSESVASGAPGTAITYTFTYTNTGNATATNVTIEDTLDPNLSYMNVGSKARWSGTGTTPLTDAAGDTLPAAGSPNIDYYTYAGDTKIWARINSVGPGQSGTLSFDVYANAGLAPQTIPNFGTVAYDDGTGTIVSNSSNTVNFQVLQSAGVVLDDVGSSTTGAPSDDYSTVPSATQGGNVSFENIVHNTGAGTDTFNITFGAHNFPAGTSFLLFKSDKVSPLTDTNGDNIPDTGPINGNGTYSVWVQANLPAGATGGPYTVLKTATSVFDPTVSDSTWDQLTTITPNSVDLTNGTALTTTLPVAGTAAIGNALTTGFGANSGNANATVITDNYTNPGSVTTFVLYVNNTSTVPDSFNLLADMNSANGLFTTGNEVTTNWTVDFKNNGTGLCATTGASITNTGTINASGAKLVCAVVTVPAGQTPGQFDIYFQAKSPSSTASDIKRDAVVVNTVRSIQITSPNSGQIFPGGSIVYTHIIANAGNVDEGTLAAPVDPGSTVTMTLTDSLSGWTSVIYWDKNNNGALDANDPFVSKLSELTAGSGGASSAAGLSVGETATLFVKVFAPLGAAINDINTSTITATITGDITINGTITAAPAAVSNDDNTTVIAGQIRLVKTQALDATCDGVSDAGAGVYTNIDLQAKPGECVMYKVVATNDGTSDVTALVVSDSTPENTKYHDVATLVCGGGLLILRQQRQRYVVMVWHLVQRREVLTASCQQQV